MADLRFATPPLSTPTAPRMARGAPGDDDDEDAYFGLTQSLLLGSTGKTSALRSVLAAASRDDASRHGVRDGHGVGYGPDLHEPLPVQAYGNTMDDDYPCVCFSGGVLSSVLCVLGSPFFCLPALTSCVTVYPKQAVVTTVYGRFFHAFQTPGLYFINPCGRDQQIVTLKTTSVELPSVKVADMNGNPLVISAVVVYKVVDPTKAALDVINLPGFIKTNAHAVLKRIASLFPYEQGTETSLSRLNSSVQSKVKDLESFSSPTSDRHGQNSRQRPGGTTPGGTGLFEQHASSSKPNPDDANSPSSSLGARSHSAQSQHTGTQNLSLKTESHLLGETLRELFQLKTEVCGIKIVSFELSDLSYAPEIAPMMLARQQAAIWVDARATVVRAAVKITDRAVADLHDLGRVMSNAERNVLITNMMTVLSGEQKPTPTISLAQSKGL